MWPVAGVFGVPVRHPAASTKGVGKVEFFTPKNNHLMLMISGGWLLLWVMGVILVVTEFGSGKHLLLQDHSKATKHNSRGHWRNYIYTIESEEWIQVLHYKFYASLATKWQITRESVCLFYMVNCGWIKKDQFLKHFVLIHPYLNYYLFSSFFFFSFSSSRVLYKLCFLR